MSKRWPTGTVTFLFSDIEGSTALYERFKKKQREWVVRKAVERHYEILDEIIGNHEGKSYLKEGDSLQAAFSLAADAVAAAVAIQRALSAEPWGEVEHIRVRIGIHSGEAVPQGGVYRGYPCLYRCHRIMTVAHGGQVLLSQVAAALARNNIDSSVRPYSLGPHRLRDLEEPEELFQLFAPGLREDFPRLRTLDQHRNNLTFQATPLEDRIDDVRRVCQMLEDVDKRLITLTGPGGVGKTRVALQAAADVLPQFRDGVFLVELDSVSDASLVMSKIATVMEVPGSEDTTLEQNMISYLKDKQVLIVLDNFEHVRSESAKIERLLSNCAQLKVLVTSRFDLVASGEWTHDIQPLALPDESTAQSLKAIAKSPAVQLFVARARALHEDFALTKDNARQIAAICRQVDGLPLAIELVVRQLRTPDVGQLLERLERTGRPLDLATGGPIGVAPRQQTMSNAIAWSYDLLEEQEQILFRRLSIFAGSFGLEAVQVICQGEDTVKDTVIEDLLYKLVDSSLVQMLDSRSVVSDGSKPPQPRFKLFETIRQFAADALRRSGEKDLIRRNHRDYYLEMAEKADPGHTGADEANYIRLVHADYDNFQAVLQRTLDRKEYGIGLRLASALARYWQKRSSTTVGRQWLENLLARSATHPYVPLHVKAKAYDKAGDLAWTQGDFDSAQALFQQSLDLYVQAEDPLGQATVYLHLGNVERDRQNVKEATAHYLSSLAIFERLNDKWGIAAVNNNMGTLAIIDGRVDEAEQRFLESLVAMTEVGSKIAEAAALVNLCLVARVRGNLVQAKSYCHRGLALSQELEDKQGMANAQDMLGNIARELGDFASARRHHGEALKLRQELGEKRRLPYTLIHLGEVEKAEQHYDEAKQWFEQALQYFRDLPSRAGIALALLRLGEIECDTDKLANALDRVSQALVLYVKLELKTDVVSCLEVFVEIAIKRGDMQGAARLSGAAAKFSNELDISVTEDENTALEYRASIISGSLGAADYAKHYRSGEALTFEAAVREALDMAR